MSSPTRKLAAIMFTDIVGYTALSAKDEEKALVLIDKQREVLKPLVENFGGNWLKEIGDGLLISFPSSKQAVNCAIKIQQTVKEIEDLNLRIGIHQGDILEKDGDVFGDDVNIASRIEPFAAVGGVAISGKINDDISGSPEITTKYVCQPKLKGIKQVVQIHCIISDDLPATVISEVSAKLEFEPETLKKSSKSIAVLPFSTFSSEQEDIFFSDGVHDDILTQLTKIKDLMVISRTSVIRYKDTHKPISQIAVELNVLNILEGSVRRAGKRVRIVAQLINANTDEHLWAETYDRDYVDIFAIQSDVAKKIASSLEATLTPNEIALIEERPTKNMEAYDFYIQANVYERLGNETKNREIAIDLYRKAVALDSTFAQAYAKICLNHARLYYIERDHRSHRLDKAKEAIDKAIYLKPDDPVVRVANGRYFYYGFMDYARALDEFYFAQKTEPGNGKHASNIAAIQRRLGKFDEALINFKIALEHDPHLTELIWEVGGTYGLLRRYDLAEQFYDRAIGLADQSHSWSYYAKAWLQIYRSGNTENARKIALQHVNLNTFGWMLFDLDLEEGHYKEALDRLSTSLQKVRRSETLYMPKEAYVGWIFELMGQPDESQKSFNIAHTALKDELNENYPDPRIHAALGWVYAHIGEAEEAVSEGLKAVELLPVSVDALLGPHHVENLAQIYVIVGQHDKALNLIEHLLEIPCLTSVGSLRFHLVWDPLRENAQFKKLLGQS